MITERKYQTDAIDDLTTAAANGSRRLLLQAVCGSGKTIIASRIIQNAVKNGHKVLFLAHRRELVKQCVDKLASFGVEAATIMSGECWDKSLPVSVASIQSLHAWAIRRKLEPMPPADLVVQDEAHHGHSKTWKEIINAYPQAIVLGLTATPINRRGCGMGNFFDSMVKCPSVVKLTEDGYLVPARYYAPTLPDLKGIKVIAGDYVESQLEERMDRPKLIGDIVQNWSRICPERQTLVFGSGVKHSIHIAESFNAIGVRAAHVDGNTPKQERDKIVADFSDGKIQVLSNCQIFTEGTDIPSASCLIFARPTKSLLLYLQVIGRVLRPFPGKSNAYVIDHSGAIYEHGPADQERDWQLDYGKGDVRTSTALKFKLKKEITCFGCKCVYFGRLECPECGTIPVVRGREVKTYNGFLQALDDIENYKPDRKSWYLMLLHYCREKQKLDGWAYHKFIDKFDGEKPPWAWRNLETIPPSLEVQSWIRSRNIAWAKSKYNKNKPIPMIAQTAEVNLATMPISE